MITALVVLMFFVYLGLYVIEHDLDKLADINASIQETNKLLGGISQKLGDEWLGGNVSDKLDSISEKLDSICDNLQPPTASG